MQPLVEGGEEHLEGEGEGKGEDEGEGEGAWRRVKPPALAFLEATSLSSISLGSGVSSL